MSAEQFYPTEREQGEISNQLLEEAPVMSDEELHLIFLARCEAWCREAERVREEREPDEEWITGFVEGWDSVETDPSE